MTKRGWLFIGVLGLIWGTPYLFIRVAVLELSPPVVVFSRLLLGALVLLPLALRQGQGGVLRTHWKGILTFALIEMVIPFGALGIAESQREVATVFLSGVAFHLLAEYAVVAILWCMYRQRDERLVLIARRMHVNLYNCTHIIYTKHRPHSFTSQT